MVQYLLNATAIWLVCLLSFDIFLKKENYHAYNRFYLLFTFLLGIALPIPQLLANPFADAALFSEVTARWLRYVYFSGAAVAFIILLIDVLRLVVIYRAGRRLRQDEWTIVETGKEHPPFSYLDILFVTDMEQYSAEEWNMIMSHEQRHSILLHLVDMLMMQLVRVVLWFHPFGYIYQARLSLVHEYQADLSSTGEIEQYGKFLVEQAVLKAAPSFSHSFNRSPIKKRILMLTKNKKPRTGLSNLKLLIIVPLTLMCILFFRTKSYSINPPGEIWKKQVVRVIDFTQAEDTVRRHIRNAEPDSLLMEMLLNGVYSGKLTAYSNFDTHFTLKDSKDDIKEMLTPKPDTVILVNPATGKEQTKVVKHDFDCSTIHKYRILEEWTYNQHTKKTEIAVLGIAPIQEIYVDNVFRGVRAIFWLKYNDVQPILNRYELYHPHNTIESHIWEDNFKAREDANK